MEPYKQLYYNILIYRTPHNTVPIRIGRNATVSQRAFLCTSGHDITDSRYHQTNASIVIEDRAWVCAEAFVGQGVTAGEGAVCAARAVVIKDVQNYISSHYENVII